MLQGFLFHYFPLYAKSHDLHNMNSGYSYGLPKSHPKSPEITLITLLSHQK